MKHKKTSARVLSLVLTMAMLLSLLPTAVFATEGTVPPMVSEMPACHTAHGADCGYMEAVAGTPAVAEVPCDKSCGDIHAEGCAYAAAVAEVPAIVGAACAHTCDVCQPMGALAAEDSTPLDGSTASETTDADKLEEESIPSVEKQARAAKAPVITRAFELPYNEDSSCVRLDHGAECKCLVWVADTKTLTLTNATMQVSSTVPITNLSHLSITIELNGENEISYTGTSNNPVIRTYNAAAITIQGSGTLVAKTAGAAPVVQTAMAGRSASNKATITIKEAARVSAQSPAGSAPYEVEPQLDGVRLATGSGTWDNTTGAACVYEAIPPAPTISFDARNGQTIAAAEIVNGKITLPADPTWKDYTFGGWFTEKDGADTEVTAETALTASATVYAKWTAANGKTVYTQPIDLTGTPTVTNGDGWAWDNTGKTLTLDGVNIDCSHNKVATELTYGISLPAPAKIVLAANTTNNIVAGDNAPPTAVKAESSGILGAGDITIQGKGTLTTTGGGAGGSSNNGSSYGIKINSGTITMSEGTVSATGGTSHAGGESNSYGIYSPYITVNGGTVNAKSDSSTGVSSAVSSGMYATEAVEINRGTVNATGGISSGTSCGISGQTVTINSGTVNAEGVLASGTSYGIRGTSITINGGTGTVKTTSDRETDKNAFNVEPIGTLGTTLTNALSVTWTSPTISFDARNGQTIDDAEIVGGKITLPADPTWEDYTFDGWYTEKDGTGTSIGKFGAEYVVAASATVYAKWTKGGKLVYTKPIDLTGTPTVTNGDGWAWDNTGKTLTLNGLTLDCSANAKSGEETYGIKVPDGANIILVDGSTNVIKARDASDNYSYAISAGNTCTISGTGSLEVVGGAFANESYGIYASTLSITDATITALGKTAAILSVSGTITADGATVTGAKETFASGTTKTLTQENSDVPVVISFGPSIAVAAQTGDATYGTVANTTFAITNSNFGGDYPDFVPSIAWTSGNAPTGVTAAISEDKTSITMNTTAATPAGEYKFKVVSPKESPETGNYESAVATLKVDQLTATITWGEALSFPYNGEAQAPSATVSNKVGSDDVTVTVTGGQTNVGTGYTATASDFGGAAAANYAMPSTNTTITFEIIKAAYSGTQATAPDASRATKTDATVTLAVQTPPDGEAVEYGYSATADGSSMTWQDTGAFTGLTSNTEYYFFARVKANNNHNEGTTSAGTAIKTDLSDADKVAAAKTAVTTALNDFIATNATDAGAIMAVVTKALDDATIAGVAPSWAVSGAFSKTPAAEDAAGSVTGTITLTCGAASDTVALNSPIAQLPSDPTAKLALAKTAIEAALNAYKPSNETTAADVKKVADDAVTAAGVTGVTTAWGTPAFAKTESTNSADGKITGALTVTIGDKTDKVSVNLTVERTDEQKLADIKLKVEIELAGMTATNDTTADAVMAVVNKVLTDTDVTAAWKGFKKIDAIEGVAGSITGKITLTLNSATSDATVDLVIAKIAVNKTALTEAITAANLAKNGVSINNNPIDVVANGTKFVTAAEMKAFTDAITAAQAVANDPNATTEQVTAAVSALASAVKTFNTATKTGTFTGTATHTPIGNIEILLGTATAGTDLTLSATITPASATNKTIVWSVKTANATGATIENGKLKTTAAGTVVLTATIASGTNATIDYTQDFTITVLAANATVSGTVKDSENIAVSGATVQLMQGKTKIGEVNTGADGKYIFTDVPNGVYQLVITNATGTTITESITANGTTVTEDIKFLGSEKNTVVEITSTTPNVAVGGMNELLNPENLGTTLAPAEKVAVDNGGSVVLTFTAALKTASEVADDKTKIEGLATGKKIDMLIDLSVLKTVKDNNTNLVVEDVKITSLVSVIEVVIPIPAQLQGKADLSIYRVHNGTAETLSKDVADANGEYYTISADGTYATLHIKNFSTYAFGYTETSTPPSGGGSSSGSVTPSYTNTINKPENGTVTMTPSYPSKGQTVTITTKPDVGYEVDQIIVKDADGNSIAVTKTAAGGYTFVQPAGKVTVEVTYKKTGTSGAASFADVTENDWFYKAVMTATAKGWFNGTSETSFSPNQSTNRGMIATILHRIDSTPGATTADFIDVAADAYYTNGVAWAQANGIVTGYGNGSYGPTDDITREQLAAILYRFAKYKNYDTSKTAALSSFTDASTVSSYANEAMSWAVGAGLISGRESNTLAPNASATRAEVATILVRFAEQFIK